MNARPRRRWLRRLVWLAAVVLLLSSAWGWRRYAAWADLQAARAEAAAAGLHTSWEPICADAARRRRERYPDGHPLLAAIRAAGHRSTGGTGALMTADLPLCRAFHSPAVRPEAQKLLSRAEAVWPLLANLGSETAPPFAEGFGRPNGVRDGMDAMADNDAFAYLLQPAVIDALGRGDARLAFGRIALCLEAQRHLAAEPYRFAQHVNAAALHRNVRTLGYALRHAAPTAAEFDRLDGLLADIGDGFRHDASLDTLTLGLADAILDPNEYFELRLSARTGSGWKPGWWMTAEVRAEQWLIAHGFARPEQWRAAAACWRAAATVRGRLDSGEPLPAAIRDRLAALDAALLPVLHVPLADWYECTRQFRMRGRRCAKLGRWALRVRQHFDRHGQWPKTLAACADGRLPAGDDPLFPQGIDYALTPDGPRLLEANANYLKFPGAVGPPPTPVVELVPRPADDP